MDKYFENKCKDCNQCYDPFEKSVFPSRLCDAFNGFPSCETCIISNCKDYKKNKNKKEFFGENCPNHSNTFFSIFHLDLYKKDEPKYTSIKVFDSETGYLESKKGISFLFNDVAYLFLTIQDENLIMHDALTGLFLYKFKIFKGYSSLRIEFDGKNSTMIYKSTDSQSLYERRYDYTLIVDIMSLFEIYFKYKRINDNLINLAATNRFDYEITDKIKRFYQSVRIYNGVHKDMGLPFGYRIGE